ncbi:MAG TPA: hypothetical protein VKV27_01105 [Solirubrobacteraceae bacterium]|nr:hypothetical protein [Solirubrobacteraceae bacterium]
MTLVIVFNVVLSVLILGAQVLQLARALREPKGPVGSGGARLLARLSRRGAGGRRAPAERPPTS